MLIFFTIVETHFTVNSFKSQLFYFLLQFFESRSCFGIRIEYSIICNIVLKLIAYDGQIVNI